MHLQMCCNHIIEQLFANVKKFFKKFYNLFVDSGSVCWYNIVTLCAAYILQYKLNRPGIISRSRVTIVTVDSSPTGQ